MAGKAHILFIIFVSCLFYLSAIANGRETTFPEGGNMSILVSPDGRYLGYGVPAYSKDGECITRIMISKPDGTEQTLIKEVPACEGEVLWMGNGRLICSGRDELRYAVVSRDGNALADIVLPAECDILYKRLSPDGNRVAFVGNVQKSDYGLFVIELKTGKIRCLINKALKSAPAWSPDSRKIAIGNSPGYVKEYPLVIVDVETNEVSATGIEGVGASWSRDGKFLAFTTEVVQGGSWYYGIPMDGQIGILDIETKQLTYVTPPAHNIIDKDAGKIDREGYIQPAWSPDGNWIAFRKISYSRAGKDSERKETYETWIADPLGRNAKKVADGFGPVGWAQDSRSLFILKETQIDGVNINDSNVQTLVSWVKPEAPRPTPADTIIIRKPGVVAEITWIDKVYGEALANVLFEARREYEESFGLSLPKTITLQANREPRGETRLWTDGESYLFLTIKSKDDLAPPSRSGVFNIYGMCHELGHIVMYRKMRNQVGLPDGVGEGWAYYTGSVVVDAVAQRLGQSIWPEPYDAAATDGSARLRKSIENKKWEDLSAHDCAAKVFYELDKKYGRKVVGSAMNAALSNQPSGSELMPLFVKSIRELTADPNAGDWIPQRMLVPETKWEVKQRHPDDSFFSDIKILPDENGVWLHYDDGTNEGQQSTSGSGHAVLFQKPDGNWLLDGINVFGSRYGEAKPPDANFTVYVCDEDFNPVSEFSRPYRLFQRGTNRWFKINIEPVRVPKRFYICLSFDPTNTRGVYVTYDESVEHSHSFSALPYTHVSDVESKYDWMIRAHLCKTPE
jgi:hypothetical protein